jgi:uncharacterized protein involved in exopolysaccharide biosynthesis
MKYFLTILIRYGRVTLAVFVAILAVASTLTMMTPKKYETHMKVLVKHGRAEPVVGPDISTAVVRGDVSETDVNSEIELLTSTELLRAVAVENNLADGRSGSQPAGVALDRAVRELRRDLSVSPVRKASIIQVDYSSTDPDRSVAVLKTLGDRYLEMHLRVHSTAGAEEFFKAQAAEYQLQLRAAQTRLAEMRRHDNVVLLADQKELTLRRMMDAESASNEARTSLDETVSRVASLRRQLVSLEPRIVTQSRAVPNQYLVERLSTMLAELQNRRTERLAKFPADDRLVLNLDDQIRDTTAALDRARAVASIEQTTDVDPLRENLSVELAHAEMTLAGLEARRASLAANLSSWRARLQQLDLATVEHESVSREARLAEEKMVLYVKKQEEARIDDALDRQKFANVTLVEGPVRPYLPSQPNLPVNLGLGFLVACFGAVATAFVWEVNRTTIDAEDDVQSTLGVPVLAAVPAESA